MHTRSAIFVLFALFCSSSMAEEGMWTFDNPPRAALQEDYGFSPSQAWLDHVRLSSVRFMNGGSGSFVSSHGLVVTNHHVAVGQLQKISTEKMDYVEHGFYAKTQAEEIKSPDLEVTVLASMEDVTARVMAAVKPRMRGGQAIRARLAERAKIEKESLDATGLRSEVVSLYQGGEYWLYRYRKYTDVRLVMAPERQAAAFGGDDDNFTYPRYCADFAFFRVYEDGKPLQTDNYLAWSKSGAADGELVFITGHPGRTDRLQTLAQLELHRDVDNPLLLDYLDRSLTALRAYAEKGPEQARRAGIYMLSYANAQKAYGGMQRSLESEASMRGKRAAEQAFRKRVTQKPAWRKKYGRAWTRIAQTLKKHRRDIARRSTQDLFGSRRGPGLLAKAITIVQYVQEVAKADGDRLDGFHDSELEALRFRLFSPAPIYPDLEAVMLETAFRFTVDKLGKRDKLSRIILALGDPRKAAEKMTAGTKLVDAATRRALIDGGAAAVKKSDDPLIVLARKIAPILAANERWEKKTIDSVITPAAEAIARARFEILGKSVYPDATFTLRLTYGPVKGYPYNGTLAPYKTTLYGLYNRTLGFDGQGEFALPDRFAKGRDKLDLSTPVNFVSVCDIIGGNSGSPVINKKAELVGVVFDGNMESLAGRYFYDPTANRAVSVHSAYILEALNKLYDAGPLVAELTANPAASAAESKKTN